MAGHAVIASYNTHGGVGLDRRFAPRNIARVIGELRADIVALQEVRSRTNGCDMLELLRDETGFHAVAGPTLTHANGAFGNGLLTRFPVLSIEHVKLDVARREPRGAIDAVLDVDGTPLRVIATHLGLSPRERHAQITRLLYVARERTGIATILLGDLNEWLLRRRALHWLHEHFGESPARATFPSLLPMFALDRIWCLPASAMSNVRVHRSHLARTASDHLPLLAELDLRGEHEADQGRATRSPPSHLA